MEYLIFLGHSKLEFRTWGIFLHNWRFCTILIFLYYFCKPAHSYPSMKLLKIPPKALQMLCWVYVLKFPAWILHNADFSSLFLYFRPGKTDLLSANISNIKEGVPFSLGLYRYNILLKILMYLINFLDWFLNFLIFSNLAFSYCMSKKPCPFLYSEYILRYMLHCTVIKI